MVRGRGWRGHVAGWGCGVTVVELFAGAGGASLGLIAAGFEEVRAVEWNHDACETRRAAGLRCDEGDVRDPAHYAGVIADAVWSSFPCQAWSTAGKRLGKDDPRNGWPWTVDVLDQVKPVWFMAENVPGLTHHRGACNGRCVDDCARLYFEGTILRQLGERFAWVGWRILDAARFGVPQNRERLIIVAGPRPIQWPRETHAPPEELRAVGLFADGRKPWRTVREALGLGGSLRPERGAGMCERHGERPDHSVDDPAPTIGAGSAGSGPRLQVIEDPKHPHVRPDAPAPALRSGGAGHSAPPMWLRTEMTGASATPDTRPAPTVNGKGNTYAHPSDPGVRMPAIMREDPSRGWEAHGIDEPSPAVRAGRPGGGLGTRAASRPELLDKPSPTVTAREVKGNTGDALARGRASAVQSASDMIFLGAGIRRLTPAECATLQDFPPDHPWRGTKTSIYAQIGNAVCRTVAYLVACAVEDANAALQEDQGQRSNDQPSSLRGRVPPWQESP